jgi:hypothetical protein
MGHEGRARSGLIAFLRLFFRLERLGHQFPVRFLQQNLDAAFGFFELLLALARKLDAFLEKLHGFVERELRAFQAPDDFFEAREGLLKIGLLGRLWSFYRC